LQNVRFDPFYFGIAFAFRVSILTLYPYRFVCAFTKALNTPVLLRTYNTDGAVDALSSSDCTIWQAARATSAAASFFDPIKIGRQRYVDGATGLNNPVEEVLEEAKSIWPDAVFRIQCIVSIGTGVPDLKDFGDNLKEVVETLKAISTETEETEKRFFRNYKDHSIGDRYFRFNVQQGLGSVGLDEHEKVDRIEAATERYLGAPQMKASIDAFIAARAPNICM
jgi:predicted acylesterase/phospholipase RssA